VLCECDDERILIDCGFGTRTIKQRLAIAGVDPLSVSGCLVTHEHSDHVSGVAKAAAKWRWPVFATAGTALASNLREGSVTTIRGGDTLPLGRMSIEVIATPHDAAESVGYVITSISTGARVAIFYDIGRVTASIRAACEGASVLMIESNHDDEMLRWGPYPLWLQERIRGSRGHLSNRDAGELVGGVVNRELQHVVLAHLSEKCNTPRKALDSMSPVLRKARFRGRVTAAPQERVVGPFEATGGGAAQIELF
jgi:phosphoribosyl 1,2-cyclic phosphodiesterase